jgi:cell division protein FtsB
LIEKYKHISQENDFLTDRVDFLETQNFNLSKDLNEKSAVTSYLQELSRSQQSRLEFLDKENKQLKARVEYLSNQG